MKILLTGDDGYNSLGTRLLISALKPEHALTVAATKTQMSGVSGTISMKNGFNWEETEIDGVKAYVVDGTPADAMELCAAHVREHYDLVISGINLGANIGASTLSSGTIGAAARAIGINLAKKAIALSWDIPSEFWTITHDPSEDLTKYMEYPLGVSAKLVDLALANNLWGARLLNINLPATKSTKILVTKPISDLTKAYDYSYKPDPVTKHFDYVGERKTGDEIELEYDAKALSEEYISISPYKDNFLDEELYTKMLDFKFAL
jgi:5'-nucleotidase